RGDTSPPRYRPGSFPRSSPCPPSLAGLELNSTVQGEKEHRRCHSVTCWNDAQTLRCGWSKWAPCLESGWNIARCPGAPRPVSALARLALACLLVLPVWTTASSLIRTTAFLVEFLGQGRWRPLSAITRSPTVRPLPWPATSAGPSAIDLYASPALRRAPGRVRGHGLRPGGRAEPRLRDAADLLARAGWAVAVPTVTGLTVLRLRPDDAATVGAAVRALRAAGYSPVAVLGVSLGAGPALLSASEPAVAPEVSAVLALGGYAS